MVGLNGNRRGGRGDGSGRGGGRGGHCVAVLSHGDVDENGEQRFVVVVVGGGDGDGDGEGGVRYGKDSPAGRLFVVAGR